MFRILSKQLNDSNFSVSVLFNQIAYNSGKEQVLETSCRYDPYFLRMKHFRRKFKVAILNYTELYGSILNADSLLMTS